MRLTGILFWICMALFVIAGNSGSFAYGSGSPVQAWTPKMRTFAGVGKAQSVLNSHQEAVLLSHKGAGCLTHMWFGGAWPGYEKTVIRVYVDGEATPSISFEVGLGNGIGFGDGSGPMVSDKMGVTGNVSGFYNTYRIPFGTGIRVTAQCPPNVDNQGPFWWVVTGTDGLRVALGGVLLPETARLHVYSVHDYEAKPLEQITMCDAKGPGAVYEVSIAAHGLTDTGGWKALSFMEGCVRGYFDGEATPELLSSGFEDYFLGTYYFKTGKYQTSLSGVTHLDTGAREVAAYRFHDDDPLFFQKSLKLTCRDGDTANGAITGEPFGGPANTVFNIYVWVYQW